MKLFVRSPLAEVLRVLTGTEPPKYVRGLKRDSELSEDQEMDLHSWCCQHAKPDWSTGIGTIEAANSLVQEAIDNGNIYDPRSCEVCEHYRSASYGACMASYGRCAFLASPVCDLSTCPRFKLSGEYTDD